MKKDEGMQEGERRQFSRIEFNADVTLTQEGETLCAQLEDISLNGVLLSTTVDHHLRDDVPCMLDISLTGDVTITMQVTLVHSSPRFLGLHCTSIDMESVIHLRRLVEINLVDPRASERVLAELLKRHQNR